MTWVKENRWELLFAAIVAAIIGLIIFWILQFGIPFQPALLFGFLSSSFGSSLALLVIGAGLTGLLIPWITRRWQVQQQALKTKSELIREMTVLVAEMQEEKTANLALLVLEIAEEEDEPIFPGYEGPPTDPLTRLFAWHKRSLIIRSRMKAYYKSEGISRIWDELFAAYNHFVWLDHIPLPAARAERVQSLQKYLKGKVAGVNWIVLTSARDALESPELQGRYDESMGWIGNALAYEFDEVTKMVLGTSIRGEFALKDWF